MTQPATWLDSYFTPTQITTDGTPLTQRTIIDISGGGVVVSDDPSGERTLVAISGAPYTSTQNVADGETANVPTDMNALVRCDPTTSAGCIVPFPSSQTDGQAMNLKTGPSTTATNKTHLTASSPMEAPLVPGTFPAHTADMTEAGMALRYAYNLLKDRWEIQ